jgi:hypothetical protein
MTMLSPSRWQARIEAIRGELWANRTKRVDFNNHEANVVKRYGDIITINIIIIIIIIIIIFFFFFFFFFFFSMIILISS